MTYWTADLATTENLGRDDDGNMDATQHILIA